MSDQQQAFRAAALARRSPFVALKRWTRSHAALIAAFACIAGMVAALGVASALTKSNPTTATPTSAYVNASTTWTFGTMSTGKWETISTSQPTSMTFPSNFDLTKITGISVPSLSTNGTWTVSGRTLTIRWTKTIPRRKNNWSIQITGLQSPSQPASGGAVGAYSVAGTMTSSGGVYPMTWQLPAGGIGANPSSVSNVVARPEVAGLTAATTYTVSFTPGANGRLAGATAAGGNTISCVFPTDTVVPAAAPTSSVLVNGSAPATVSIAGRTVTLKMPPAMTISPPTSVAVTFTSSFGLRNPSSVSDTYTIGVSTSAENGVAQSNPYTVGTIVPTSISLASNGLSAAGFVKPGQSVVVDRFLLTRIQGSKTATVTKVSLDDSGTVPSSLVTGVRVYRDVNGNGSLDASDTLLNSIPATFTSTVATVTFDAAKAQVFQVTDLTPRQYLVAYAFSGAATNGQGASSLVTSFTTTAQYTSNGAARGVPFTIDTDGPLATWTQPSVDSTTVTDPDPAGIGGDATDAGAGVGSVVVQIQRNDGKWWSGSAWIATPASLTAAGTDAWTCTWGLMPASQDGTPSYTLAATPIDALGNVGATAYRYGITVDNTGPTIAWVNALDGTHVDLEFSEAIEPTSSAALLAHISFDNGLTASAATLDANGRTVHLTTSAQSQTIPSTYTVSVYPTLDGGGNTVTVLADLVGNTTDTTRSAMFYSGGKPNLVVSQGSDPGWPGNSVSPAYCGRDATRAVDELALDAAGGSIRVTTLTVRGLDTTASLRSDVPTVSLFRDDGDGYFGAGDTLVGAKAFSSDASSGAAVATFSVNSTITPAAPSSYWVVYKIGAAPGHGHYAGSRAASGDAQVATGTVTFPTAITSPNLGQTLGIDLQAPSTSDDATSTWQTSPFAISLSASDAPAGVAATFYTLDGASLAQYTGPVDVGTDGTHTIQYYSVDNAGNVEGTHTATARLDQTPPVTTDNAPLGWVTTTTAVTLAPSDSVSGVFATFYSLNGGPTTAYAVPITISTDGLNTLQYYSVDVAGNMESSNFTTLELDTGAPQTTDDAPIGWVGTDTTVTLTASDSVSGVSATYFSVDGSAAAAYASPLPFSAEGTHTLQYSSVDYAGNVEATHSPTVKIDKTAPATTDNAPGGWQKASVAVSLTTSDSLSGVASRFYRLNGGALTTYSAPVTVSAEGTNTLQYYAVDNVGNLESAHTATVTIDKSAPVTTDTAPGSWQTTSPVAVSLITSDSLSGVANRFYRLDSGALTTYTAPVSVSGDGTHTLQYYAVDTAGNAETTKTATVRIDATAPHTGDDAPSGVVGYSPVNLHLFPSDSAPGSGLFATWYSLDSGSLTTYTASVPVAGDGTHTVQYFSQDLAGNREPTETATVKIDTSIPDTIPPNVSFVPSPAAPNGSNGWYVTSPSVSVTSNEPANLWYSLVASAGPWTSYGAPVVIPGQGAVSVWAYGVDSAGNTSTPVSWGASIDKAAPVTTDTAPAGWQGGNVSVALNTSDSVSGIASRFYRLNGGALTTYSAPVTVSTEGTNTLQYFARDVAGNTEATKTATVKIDKSSPVTTDTAPAGWQTAPLLVSLNSSDSLSGVANKFFKLNAAAVTTYLAPIAIVSEGTSTIQYFAVDRVGNVEATKSATVRLDTVAPRTDVTAPSGVQGSKPVTVTLTPSDATSGIKVTYYAVNGGSLTTYTVPISVSSEGTTTITFHSVDVAGNVEPTQTATVVIDTQMPSLTITGVADGGLYNTTVTPVATSTNPSASIVATLNGAPFAINSASIGSQGTYTLVVTATNPQGISNVQTLNFRVDRFAPTTTDTAPAAWQKTNVSVALSATDTLSGVAVTKYRLNGGALTTYTAPVLVSAEGTNTLQYYSVDVAGNVEGLKAAAVKIDKTAPGTTDTAPGAWQAGNVSVTLTTSDTLSGNAATKYRLNGGALTTYTVPVVISAEGTNTLQYFATDKAGNVEATKTATVRIDKTDPSTGSNAPAGWQNANVSVSLVTSDVLSGVAARYYKLNNGTVTTYTVPVLVSLEGTNTLQYFAVDNAGNVESTRSATVKIDKTAPVSQASAPTTWQPGSTVVSISTSDSLSGLANEFYRLNGGAVTTYSAPVTVTAEGTNTLQYFATDKAGNVEATKTVTVKLDLHAPVTSSNAPASWASTGVAVSLATSDSLSGTSITYYRVNAAGFATYTAPFQVTSEGTNTVEFYSVDNVGNVESVRSVLVQIDKTLPTSSDDAPSAWQKSDVAVTISSADVPSGIAKCFYKLNGGALTTYTVPVVVSSAGTNTLQYFAKDLAGNVEPTNTVTVKIDKAAPVTTDNAPSTPQSSTVNVSLVASDAVSGVLARYYSLDGAAVATYAAPISISAEGVHTLAYFSADKAGNVEATKTVTVTIDKTPPTGTMSINGGDSQTATRVVAVVSDVTGASQMRVDSGAGWSGWTTYTPSYPATLTAGNGLKTVNAQYRDLAGNLATLTASITLNTALPDVTPPTMSALLLPASPDGTNGIYVTPPIITLFADEPAAIFYSLVASTGPWTPYASPFVAGEGTTTAYFYGRDLANNTSTVSAVTVVVDTVAPTGTVSVNHGSALASSTAVSVDSSVTGAVQMRVDAGLGWSTWAPYTTSLAATMADGDGTKTVTAQYRDLAGNVRTLSDTIVLDTTPPVVSITGVIDGNSYGTTVTPLFSSDDASAAVKGKLNGANFASGTAISLDGTYTLVVTATDAAGNIGTAAVQFWVVRTGFTGTMSLNHGAIYTTSTAISIDSTAAGAVQIQVDTGGGFGPWVSYLKTLAATLPSGDGPKTVTVAYIDGIGRELQLVDTIILDTTPPDVTIGGVAEGGDYTSSAVATATSGDPAATLSATLNGAAYTLGKPIAGWGSYTLVVTAKDPAGNKTSQTVHFTVSPEPAPSAPSTPTGLVAAPSGLAISLHWRDNPENNVVRYNVYRSTKAAGPFTIVPTSSVTFSNWLDSTVALNTPYYYSVTAVDTMGRESGASTMTVAQLSTVIRRLGGKTRYDVAVGISQDRFASANTVVIATGMDFPDALAAASLAGCYHAPLLLVPGTTVPSSVFGEIARLGAKKAIVCESAGAVSPNVDSALRARGLTVQRVAGTNRYDESRQIANEVAKVQGASLSKTAYVARGDLYTDALSVSPLAYRGRSPILFTMPKSMDSKTYSLITNLGFQNIVIVGGTGSVSPSIEARLRGMGLNVTRLGGKDRYAASYSVAQYAFDNGILGRNFLCTATGLKFPDALTGGAASGESNGVLMLTTPRAMSPYISTVLRQNKSQMLNFRIAGGPASVSDIVLITAREILLGH